MDERTVKAVLRAVNEEELIKSTSDMLKIPTASWHSRQFASYSFALGYRSQNDFEKLVLNQENNGLPHHTLLTLSVQS